MLERQILAWIKQASGLDISSSTVAHAMKQRMKQAGIVDQEAYKSQLMASDEELTALLEQLVVPETWFFRDAAAFAAAVQFVGEHRVSRARPIRILSIPSSTGEEPYSIAMAMLDAGFTSADCSIAAIDISQNALTLAKAAVYQTRSFRTTDLSFRSRYFQETDHGYALAAQVRDMVSFGQGNLLALNANLAGEQAFDLIFCRNLLIYFDAPTQQQAIAAMADMLADDGLLFTGYAETTVFCQRHFSAFGFPKAYAVRKKAVCHRSDELPESPQPQPQPPAQPQPQPQPQPPAASPRLKMPGLPIFEPNRAKAVVPATPAVAQPIRANRSHAKPAHADVAALLNEAQRLANKGDINAARTQLDQLLKQVPDSAAAHFLYGLIHEQAATAELAEKYFRRAVYLEPNHYEALCHLALLVAQQGRIADADALMARAARIFKR